MRRCEDTDSSSLSPECLSAEGTLLMVRGALRIFTAIRTRFVQSRYREFLIRKSIG
jgi:hypothetical protein